MTHQFAALLGNGVSLVYNQQLSVASLTNDRLAEFRKLGAKDEAGHALLRIAEESRGGPHGFESMLGPLESVSRSLEALSELTEVVRGTPVAEPLQHVQAFVDGVRRIGLATVLGMIAKRSKDEGQEALRRSKCLPIG